MPQLLIDIALCIIAAWVLGVFAHLLKQPLLLAYLLAGFLIGPACFRFVTAETSIATISEIGLILLLFMIGLELDLKKMLSAGKVITIAGFVQVFACIALGWAFFCIPFFQASRLEALYLAVAAAMSSTIIIVKVLYDKHELDTLSGRITLGIMVLQDLVTIMFLAIQPNLSNPEVVALAMAFGKVFLLIVVGYVVSRFLLPPIFRFAARLPELVLIGALAWCFAMAGFAAQIGLSSAMGALIAGVMVSTFPYTLDVVAKVTTLRDFFVTLFFVGLGIAIPMPTWGLLVAMLLFSMFLVGSRLVTIFIPLHFLRMGHRASLIPAINFCNLSELSIVLLALGLKSGDVTANSMAIASLAFAFLAVDSTYAMFGSETILRKTSPWLTKLGFRDLAEVSETTPAAVAQKKRVFVLGFSWTASSLLEDILREKPAMLPELQVVDFNPQVISELRRRSVSVVYGDISRRDVLIQAGVPGAEVIICTLPDIILKGASNLKLLRQLRELNPTAQIIVHADRISSIPQLYAAGANYVSVPRLLESAELLNVIEAANKGLLEEKRKEQLERLEERKEVVA